MVAGCPPPFRQRVLLRRRPRNDPLLHSGGCRTHPQNQCENPPPARAPAFHAHVGIAPTQTRRKDCPCAPPRGSLEWILQARPCPAIPPNVASQVAQSLLRTK